MNYEGVLIESRGCVNRGYWSVEKRRRARRPAVAVISAVQLYLGLIIARWFWKNVVPSCGTKVTFVGTYFQCLGWYLLFIISFITIIGWAWSNVGMIKWFCQNIKGDNHIVEFHGNGWNVLWRSIVFVLSCIVIIPIPWTTMWLIKWYMSNISIKKGQWGEI